MGKPITRLNPKVESRVQGILFKKALGLLKSAILKLPAENKLKRGPRPYDYRIILILCMFRILLRKTYADYEIEMRTDSGIRIIGRSIWYSLRTKKPISRRKCDKVHLATCSDTMLILNWFITEGKKNDSPFFGKLLMPFKLLGVVLADFPVDI